jgi:PST family polysaccharide transporter
MALTVTLLLAVFFELGLTTATVQSADLTQEKISALFWINTIAGLCVFLVAVALAPFAAHAYGEPALRDLIFVFALGAIPTAMSIQFTALMSRSLDFMPIQIRQIVAMLFSSAVAIGLAYWTEAGALAIAFQYLLCQSLILLLSLLGTPWRPSLTLALSTVKAEIAVARNMLGSNLTTYMQAQSDMILVGSLFGPATLGLFSRAKSLSGQLLQVIQWPLSGVMVSILAKVGNDPERWRFQYRRSIALGMLINAIPCVVLYVTSDPLIALLYGSQWLASAEVLRWMLVAAFAAGLFSPTGWAFVAQKRTKAQMYWGLASLLVTLAACVIGARWGAVGVAMAGAISQAGLALIGIAVALRGTSVGYLAVLPMVVSFVFAAAATVWVVPHALSQIGPVPAALEIILGGGLALSVFMAIVFVLSFFVESLALGRAELYSRIGPLLSKARPRRGD